MSFQISLVIVGFIALCIAGFFLIIKSFSLPGSFYKNQIKRKTMLKEKIIAVMYSTGNEDGMPPDEDENEEDAS